MHLQQRAQDEFPGYHLGPEIRTGGMGTVYEAHDERGNRVAIKVIREDCAHDHRYQAQFRREAETMLRVHHPNVMRAICFDSTPGGRAYLVMEYVEGPTLQEKIDQCGGLPLVVCVDIVMRLAEALDCVHAQHIAHADVTASNVLLDVTHEPMRPVLTDFGLAQRVGQVRLSGMDEWAHTGSPYGTSGYRAPEQEMGDLATRATDVQGLAKLLLHAHLGKLPDLSVEFSHVLPPDVYRVIVRAVRTRPDDRYQDARSFAIDLYRACQSYRHATRELRSSPGAGTRQVARGPFAVALAAGLMVVALVAISIIRDEDQVRGIAQNAQPTPSPGTLPAESAPAPGALCAHGPRRTPAVTGRTGEPREIRIDPSSYDDSSFWQKHGPCFEMGADLYSKFGVTHTHAYGGYAGHFRYQFNMEPITGTHAELRARLSADFPGYSGPTDGFGPSDVTVTVNGHRREMQRVMRDDGRGSHYTWRFEASLLRAGLNRIEFAVAANAEHANGLCIYSSALAPGQADEWITLRIT